MSDPNQHAVPEAKTVRGRLAGIGLSKAAQLFDQSLFTIASELIQNARRGAATSVAVTIEQGPDHPIAVIQDDGMGVDDLAVLVHFGRSGWNENSTVKEDWAGMGIFSLSGRGCSVESLGKKVVVSREVFSGTADAPVTTAPFRAGTTIRFPLKDQTEAVTFRNAVARNALYAPLPVSIDGKTILCIPFLSKSSYTVDHAGVRIGVYDFAAWQARRNLHTESLHPDMPRHLSELHTMNFGGHTVDADRIMVADGNNRWFVLWDVQENSDIQLTLPTRDKVVINEAWKNLRDESTLAVCDVAMKRGNHHLSSDLVAFARSRGLDIPRRRLAIPDLLRYFDSKRSGTDGVSCALDGSDNAILVPDSWGHGPLHAVYAAASRTKASLNLGLPSSHLDGDPEYDQLRRLSQIDLHITMASGREEIVKNFELADQGYGDLSQKGSSVYNRYMALRAKCLSDPPHSSPRSIRVTLHYPHSDDPTQRCSLEPVEVPFVFVNREGAATEHRILASAALTESMIDEAVVEESAVNYNSEAYEDSCDDYVYTLDQHRETTWWIFAHQRLHKKDWMLHAVHGRGMHLAYLVARDQGGSNINNIHIAALPDNADDKRMLRITVHDDDGNTRSQDVVYDLNKSRGPTHEFQ